MAHLFDRINLNFFSVLSSPNKRIYVDCIFIIYNSVDSLEDSFQGDRDFIVGKLIDYFDDAGYVELSGDDPDDNDEIKEVARTSRQKANYVINVLKNAGWLGEEELGDYKVSLNFFDYAIKIIDCLESIRENKSIEYTGEIYTIYSLFSAFDEDVDQGLNILEQAYQKTLDITRRLKSLKANIYRYYYDITKDKSLHELSSLLEKLLVEYKQNFFDSAYYNLKTRDSLPRHKRNILKSLSEILNSEEKMERLTQDVIRTKRIADYNVAFSYVEEKIRYINDSFTGLDNLMLSIDRKNEQYISAASSKILFLTSNSNNIEGLLNRLLQAMLGQKDEERNFPGIFNLSHARNLDTASLHTQRKQRVDIETEEVVFDPSLFTDDMKSSKMFQLFKNSDFNKSAINAFALMVLKDLGAVEAKDVTVETTEDYLKLILVFLYSKSTNMIYRVKLHDEFVNNNFLTFRNFTIMKGAKHE